MHIDNSCRELVCSGKIGDITRSFPKVNQFSEASAKRPFFGAESDMEKRRNVGVVIIVGLILAALGVSIYTIVIPKEPEIIVLIPKQPDLTNSRWFPSEAKNFEQEIKSPVIMIHHFISSIDPLLPIFRYTRDLEAGIVAPLRAIDQNKWKKEPGEDPELILALLKVLENLEKPLKKAYMRDRRISGPYGDYYTLMKVYREILWYIMYLRGEVKYLPPEEIKN
jgi:hypothetical protein